MSFQEEEGTKQQRFAKALDTFASADIIRLISEAENSAFKAQEIDNAFDWLDTANSRLPENVRLKRSPSDQLKDELSLVISIEDFRRRNPAYAHLSRENLKREYYGEIEQFKVDTFKKIKTQITDSMQEHNMYFQESRKWHKTDAPMVSEI